MCYNYQALENMPPWSSGQDVALSRRNLGFDSPWRCQKRQTRFFVCLFFAHSIGGEAPFHFSERVRKFGKAKPGERKAKAFSCKIYFR